MRILIARLLVVVTGLLVVALAAAFAVIRNPSDDSGAAAPTAVAGTAPGPAVVSGAPAGEQAAPASLVARGRAVYAEQRCRACHSIEGEGNPRSRLDGVALRLTEKEIRLWIVAPQQMNPAVMKRPYELPAADLDALVAYLMSTKSQ